MQMQPAVAMKEGDPLKTIQFRVKREVLQQLVNSKREKGKANSLEVLLTENHCQNLDRWRRFRLWGVMILMLCLQK